MRQGGGDDVLNATTPGAPSGNLSGERGAGSGEQGAQRREEGNIQHPRDRLRTTRLRDYGLRDYETTDYETTDYETTDYETMDYGNFGICPQMAQIGAD